MDYEDQGVQGSFYRRAERRRKTSKPIHEFEVPSNVFHRVDIKAVEKWSGATLLTCTSSKPKTQTFVIRGTSEQIQSAVRLLEAYIEEKNDRYYEDCFHTRGKKKRQKSDSIKEYVYDAPSAYNVEYFKKATESSGAKLHKQSSQRGRTTFVIKGTRGQILNALRIITTLTGEKEKYLNKAENRWLDWVEKAFPDLEHRCYFFPPVFIRRVPITKKILAGQSVYILEKDGTQTSDKNSNTPSIQKSDMVDDEALQHVILNLKTLSKELSKELSKKEVFMCLSQFPFGSYLGEPSYYPAVAHLPSPTNLPSELPWKWRQGDFDVLLIHRQYGFIVFEVKAVTGNSETSVEKGIEQATKKLKEAVEQLNKAEAMLTHLTSDIAHNVRITKTIACPNLTAQELRELISNDEQLGKDLLECFKVNNPADVVRLILCSDHLCLPKTVPPERDRKIQALKEWWQEQVCGPGKDSQFSFDMYRSMIARFCGPASTVTVPCTSEPRVCIKTINQAVAHVGDCYTAYMTLFPEQIALLTKEALRVFIAGPPGSGKTTVLLLMAIKWLQDGSNVYVLSTWERSLAATFKICHLLRMVLKTQQIDENTAGRFIFVNKNFRNQKDVEAVLKELARVARHGPLYVIADEVGPDFQSNGYIFPDFCSNLLKQIQNKNDLHFWAASNQDNVAPYEVHDKDTEGWELNYFTRSLRSPPSVTREVQLAVEIRNGTVREYSERNVPDHSDGPPVEWFYHQPQEHGCLRVEDCVVCGEMVAKFLCKELQLIVCASAPVNTDLSSTKTPNLKYRDVMILSWVQLREDAPLLKALSDAGVPVRVMNDEDIEDVATANSEVAWAAQQQLVCGFTRKVVVVLNNYDDSKGEYFFTRLRAMSRCSSKLVVVCPPPGYEPE